MTVCCYAQGDATDIGGWEAYSDDWRYFFDCMLAPSARQAQTALDKLDLVPVPLDNAAVSKPAKDNKITK